MVWFFAGGETRDDKFNIFTGSFIRLMKKIMDRDFDFIKGIYFRMPMMNVAWALNNSQKPIPVSDRHKLTNNGFNQLISNGVTTDTQLIIVSSSSGSVVAAQTACYLAEMNKNRAWFRKPFHLALGASMVSGESDLFKQITKYREEGIIGTLVFDDLQDEGDSSNGVGGKTRGEAWGNAFGLMFPVFSRKFSGPSFLNTDPVKGHLHRRRSQTVRKAIDFIEVLLVKHNLAGDQYKEKAKSVIEQELSGN
jgi:hypothetical protein